MNYTYWNIAQNGMHLFRTDEYQFLPGESRIEEELIKRFPNSEGFTILRYERTASSTMTTITN